MSTVRILLVDDHLIIREGIRRMLELEPDIRVVAEAANAQEALAMMKNHHPDMVLMDIKMPGMDGIQLTRLMKKEYPDAKILILSLYAEYLKDAIEAGAVGYIQKDLRREDLVYAVRAVTEGRAPVYLTVEPAQLRDVIQSEAATDALSEREIAVLKLVAQGAPGKEIATKLALSETTVKRILRNVSDKLLAKNRSEAVAEALRRRLI